MCYFTGDLSSIMMERLGIPVKRGIAGIYGIDVILKIYMENRTKGAWIINHTKKLQDFSETANFEDIQLAGKCGIFLSNLAASNEETQISKDKVDAIATNSDINKKLELPAIKETLKRAQLIDYNSKGDIAVLGITTANILIHTADLFEQNENSAYQKAALEISNYVSDKPIDEVVLKDYISDTFKIDSKKLEALFTQSEEAGFVDFEKLDNDKTYFNGNLFKRDTLSKTTKVLSSLSSADSRKLNELDNLITKEGCVSLEVAQGLLGETLLSKVKSIGMYDFNEVSNYTHSKIYLTKPSAFSKYGNPFEDDVLDLAKSFIASLIYGMQVSINSRGKIQNYSMLQNTLKKLLRGERVGPCTAIGEDYQILEMNRVIKLEHSSYNRYYMRLLKYDVAEVALEVIEKGELAEQSTIEPTIRSSSVSKYKGPEAHRSEIRRKKESVVKTDIKDLIRTIRF